jgi:hypothetical protein
MDPDVNLRRQLAIAEAAVNVDGADPTLVELSELVLGLSDWLQAGGFIPYRWLLSRRKRDASATPR